jgi:hypothetical protein
MIPEENSEKDSESTTHIDRGPRHEVNVKNSFPAAINRTSYVDADFALHTRVSRKLRLSPFSVGQVQHL